MGIIAAHEFITLDGYYDDPSFTFDFMPWDPRMESAVGDLTDTSSAILLGRNTFEMFAPAWSNRTVDDDPGAPFFNDTTKYVVGSTEPSVQWRNSERLGAYNPDRIRQLKDETDGGIYISGSGMLVRALLKERLLDALHLFVYPVTLGSGERLWEDGAGPNRLTLQHSEAYNNGVLHLVYGP